MNKLISIGITGAIAFFGINYVIGGHIMNYIYEDDTISQEEMLWVGGGCLVLGYLISGAISGVGVERGRMLKDRGIHTDN